MKRFNFFTATVFIAVMFLSISYAGDTEDVQATMDKTINAFNNRNSANYFGAFVDDHNVFTTVSSPLRFDASSWKDFIEQAWQLKFVNYHQQDNVIQIYNGEYAILTGYYTFKTMPEGGKLETQNGRVSIVMVKQNGKWLTTHMHFSMLF